MGVGVRPSGIGAFATYLKAQEASPTLALAHAGIGDDGALEVAKFVAGSRHLVALDLSGNEISATGAIHLAEAIRQCFTLESITLKHNRIGEGGDSGLEALCRAIGENASVRHFDVRHNGLAGALAAQCFGVLLRDKKHITHLELSWNPLDPAGGQVLLGHMKMNSTLFDCQLTGCMIPEATLLEIAQLLYRNRKANGVGMKAGPYRIWQENSLSEGHVSSRDMGSSTAVVADGHCDNQLQRRVAITRDRTNELIVRLHEWRAGTLVSHEDKRRADELLEYLDGSYKQLLSDQEELSRVKERMELLKQGFQDRELRYRGDIARARNKLLDYEKERKEMHAILSRLAEDLRLHRERSDQESEEFQRHKRFNEVEITRDTNTLTEVTEQKQSLEARCKLLEETCAAKEQENSNMRKRIEQIREGVITLRPKTSEYGGVGS